MVLVLGFGILAAVVMLVLVLMLVYLPSDIVCRILRTKWTGGKKKKSRT